MKRMFVDEILMDAVQYKTTGQHKYPEQFIGDILKIGPICEVIYTMEDNLFGTLNKVDGTDFLVPSKMLKEKIGVDMK